MSKRGIERQRRERKVREEVIGEIVKEQGESKLRREQKGRWKVNVEEIKKFREKQVRHVNKITIFFMIDL